MPIAEPNRINGELVRALKCSKPNYVAIHVNHPREISPAVRDAIARLADAGIPLVSQSVLLRGVNDDPAVLEELMRHLVELRVQPYYLHHPDLAPGTAHFRVTIADGQKIMRELRARASGLCLPHYVLDLPGGFSKANLTLSDAEASERVYRLRDADGVLHDYPVL
jgi:lysine 2,3-aminomutase